MTYEIDRFLKSAISTIGDMHATGVIKRNVSVKVSTALTRPPQEMVVALTCWQLTLNIRQPKCWNTISETGFCSVVHIPLLMAPW